MGVEGEDEGDEGDEGEGGGRCGWKEKMRVEGGDVGGRRK